ncbi:MAG: ATP synthase F1 subunit gamma [Paludisphaera borealis]|uniref:ATP synthase F1 subunit gamma n=1 Tax=Paludisphaera borealis TaxID=1387353 RepID=UPI0028415844|nr:ATP synthase F1 subunit gamma [Paludisphaera borealis]MDR3617880.1 ATP synthase F1 subunit gamma [Paludisphaera borealis]
MAKARAIIKRRKAVDNIRKITRTMELIATARFRKAMDRATEAEAYTKKIAELVSDLGETSQNVAHPLFAKREPVKRSLLLVLTSNRGLAGGYNGNVLRAAFRTYQDLQADGVVSDVEVSGKRGVTFWKYRKLPLTASYTQYEDRPQFDDVEKLAERYIAMFLKGEIDRLDVVYTEYVNAARQNAVVKTLLPIPTADPGASRPNPETADAAAGKGAGAKAEAVPYEYIPDAQGILEEIVPVSFKVRLFKCFLDAAVSEQIARMVAMRGATQNADDLVKELTRSYNRARQSQITRDLADIVGAAAALK